MEWGGVAREIGVEDLRDKGGGWDFRNGWEGGGGGEEEIEGVAL